MRNKARKKRTSILPKVIFAVFAVYAAVVISGQQLKIHDQKAAAAELNSQIEAQKVVNSELKEVIDNAGTDEYYATVARDKLGYVTKGERVFVDASSM